MISDTKDVDERVRLEKMRNDLYEKYGERQAIAETEDKENKSSISSSQALQESTKAAYLPAQLANDVNKGLEEIENLKKDGKLTDEKVKEVRQNIEVLRKKLSVMDSEIANNYTSAENNISSSREHDANTEFVFSRKDAQDIENAINSNDKVMEAKITQLINAAKEAGPQSFSEYAWSVFNDPNATIWQKWKAGGASILGWVERSLGGPSSDMPKKVYDDVKAAVHDVKTYVKYKGWRKPGKNRVPVWKQVK